MTPDAYLTALREQANREREAAAAAALKTMNAEVAAHTQSLKDETGRFREEPAGSTHPGSVSGSVAVGGVGAGGGCSGWGVIVGAFGAIAPQGGSGAGSGGVGVYRRPPAFGPGSRMEPINDPDALRHLDLYKTPLNPKMSSDGPIGGYLPAQVTDGTDPRWSSEAGRSALPSSRASLSAGILGGVGGVVAAGSARSLVGQGQGVDVGHRSGVGAGPVFGAGRAGGGLSTATSMSSVSSSTPSVGVARSFGVPGVGGFGAPVGGSGTMNAAASTSSAGSAASTASSGGVGGLRPFAPSGAGTPGAATTATAGVPGVPGAYGPGAAGVSSDRKDGKSRVGYQVVRVRDDERRPVRLSEGAGPGDVASMKPLRFDDDTDDSWE
ncbi:hypothetical protein [Schaalia sp. Marseille-Q2122]|uniref:hypothetical protein n=1 Tax=Schaalia sp. Marseille-Q2122 TaxID=2736604 RepID=UPI00158E274B|nr:hypothetical protein [Schaalia sp. Marseille-Q2122]